MPCVRDVSSAMPIDVPYEHVGWLLGIFFKFILKNSLAIDVPYEHVGWLVGIFFKFILKKFPSNRCALPACRVIGRDFFLKFILKKIP